MNITVGIRKETQDHVLLWFGACIRGWPCNQLMLIEKRRARDEQYLRYVVGVAKELLESL